VLFNGSGDALPFVLPDKSYGEAWTAEIDTAASVVDTTTHQPRSTMTAEGRSVVVLRCARVTATGAPAGAATPRQ